MSKTPDPQPAHPQPSDPLAARTLTRGQPPATAAPTPVGEGGELQLQAEEGAAQLTTNQGVAIADNQNSLKAGDPVAFHIMRSPVPVGRRGQTAGRAPEWRSLFVAGAMPNTQ